jgi:hypothetical protein
MRALVLRRTHARAFAGSYEPIEAGDGTVAFLRGGDVLAAAAIRGDGEALALPPGRWRDVLHGGEHERGVELRDGIALLERA